MKINELTFKKCKFFENFINFSSLEEKDKLSNYIKKNCSEFLNEAKGDFLFRGIRTPISDVFVADTYDLNRRPRNSNPALQELFDKELIDLGAVALRKNSIFTISYNTDASFYGEEFCIFPFNGFHYTWSKNIIDIVLNFNTAIFIDKWCIYNLGNDAKKINGDLPEVKKILFDDYYFDVNKVSTALNSLPEQNVLRKKYDPNNPVTWFSIDKRAFARTFDIQIDTGLEIAIFNGNEIWIHGEYIAIAKNLAKQLNLGS